MDFSENFSLEDGERLLLSDGSPVCGDVEQGMFAAFRDGRGRLYENVPVIFFVERKGQLTNVMLQVRKLLAKVCLRDGLFNGLILDEGFSRGFIAYGGACSYVDSPRFFAGRPVFTPFGTPFLEDFFKEMGIEFPSYDPEDPRFNWDSTLWTQYRYRLLKSARDPNTCMDSHQTQSATTF